MARYVMAEPKEEASHNDDTDIPLFINSREDALRLLQKTENGDTDQVGGSITYE